MSLALGACLIENHVTLDRSTGGPDDSFLLEKPELLQLCLNSIVAWQAIDKVNYDRKEREKSNAIFRCSMYVELLKVHISVFLGAAYASISENLIRFIDTCFLSVKFFEIPWLKSLKMPFNN